MTMKQESTEADTPTIKRVVNIKCLRFKSINENFETRSKPQVDLNKLNFSLKEVGFSEKENEYEIDSELNSPHRRNHRKEPLLKQTSELDIGDNFEIRKTNPIFEAGKSKNKHENLLSLPTETSLKNNVNNNSVNSMSRLILPRNSKEHIYEDLYQSFDPSIKTNNTYDTFYDKQENQASIPDKNDFRLTINIENQAHSSPSHSPKPPTPPKSNTIINTNENDPIYIDPADFAKDHEPPPPSSKDITIVNLSNGTISKSLGKTILTDSNINDMYKSALTEKLKLNKDKAKSAVNNSESSGVSTMFGSFLKNDDSSTSDEFSFQSQLYKESNRSESGFMGFNYSRKLNNDFLTETKELKKEMSRLSINIGIKSTDLLYNLVIVPYYQKFWIGRLNSPNVGNNLHFGDEILSVDGAAINTLENLNSTIKNSKKSEFKLKLKRLPFARIISFQVEVATPIDSILKENLTQEIFKEKIGIRLKPNTAKIEKIEENGLFFKNGLKYNPNKVYYDLETNSFNSKTKIDEKDRLTKWVITEINGDYINYHCSAEEILSRLILNNTANVVVQPYDLVKYLYNQKK